jgi:uncharacterized repeat protein (TIGR01451 family)
MQRRVLCLWIVVLLLAQSLVFMGPTLAQSGKTDATAKSVLIISPTEGSVIGGLVSVLGTVDVAELESYAVHFGPGTSPNQWIAIGEPRQAQVIQGRLAFWDTTRIPDGVYSLRVRAVLRGKAAGYIDAFVRGVLVANAPETPTPLNTPLPTATATPTAVSTATTVPLPTLPLDDGVSPYLYVTQMDQYDPLCLGWRQRYSIWVSNVGMVTLTNVVLVDILPDGCTAQQFEPTSGVSYGNNRVEWRVGTLAPGKARQLELTVNVPDWLGKGVWLTNRVEVSADQVPSVSRDESTLLSECPWLKQTVQAQPFVMPTVRHTATVEATSQTTVLTKPTLRPTATPIEFTVQPETVEKGLDVLTIAVWVALVALFIFTGVLVYRRITKR